MTVLLCPELLDGIAKVLKEVSIAQTDGLVAPDMDPVMELADTAVVDIKAPTLIAEPTPLAIVALVMAVPATVRKKPVKLSTKNIAAMSRNKNVSNTTRL